MNKTRTLNDRDTISGPYYNFSSPYGYATCQRNEWFISRRQLKPEKCMTETARILKGNISLGMITRFRDQQRRYVIVQNNAVLEFPSLAQAVKHLTHQ